MREKDSSSLLTVRDGACHAGAFVFVQLVDYVSVVWTVAGILAAMCRPRQADV